MLGYEPLPGDDVERLGDVLADLGELAPAAARARRRRRVNNPPARQIGRKEVARGIGLDNRIGTKFLHLGPGFGGSCFPKDALALIKTAQDYDSPLRIVETMVAVNDVRKRAMARKVAAALGGSVRGKLIAVLGLTFKPNTDDMRDAPSISVITALQDMGASGSCL